MKIIYQLLYYSGLPFLFREWLQRDKVTILLFHDIAQDTGRKIFSYLSKHYQIISLTKYLEARQLQQSLPRKAMILTFDDGHVRNYELLPVVQELDIPLTIFLCAGIIDTKRKFWFQYPAVQAQKEQLKNVPNSERLAALAELGFSQEKEYETTEALSRQQINAMKAKVDFQAHTMFHPCLPQCTDEEARETLEKSKMVLETDFQLPIYALAYPNGDYSDRDVALAKELGYRCALSVEEGYNSMQTDLFRLKRLDVSDSTDIHEVAVKASGVWFFLKKLLKG